jgi:hypothetical protein
MEPNEAQELQEHAEHGAESGLRPVALTMTVLAVLVAITTVMGHRTHTEAVIQQSRASLEQDRATDQWGEYQAKKNRAYDTQLATDLMSVLTVGDKKAAQKLTDGYAKHEAKWNDDLNEEEKAAREHEQRVKDFEKEVEQAEARAIRFDLAEALLEIGLVVTSVTLLTRRKVYWYAGMVFSLGGVLSALSVLLLK